jgi:hypothetical protein
MFKRVENEIELALFNFIWMTVWREKGFEFEFSPHPLERYMVVTPDGQYVGSAEFKPFTPGEGRIDPIATFLRHPRIAADPLRVAEIDKIAILKEFRGNYISELLSALVYVARQRGLHYYVSLLEPVFFRALRITYHVPMEKAGEKTFYKGDYVIPIIIDAKQVYSNPDKYEWLSFQYHMADACPSERTGYQSIN